MKPARPLGLLFHCRRCDNPIREPGGLIFGPPSTADRVTKWHICTSCFATLLDWLKT